MQPLTIVQLGSGGANKWWDLMPIDGTLPNRSLPGIPGPHTAGGVLRTTIQQSRKALPPGSITDLRFQMLDMNDELAKIENPSVFRNMGEAASNSSSVIYI
jgi:hypothetical protein